MGSVRLLISILANHAASSFDVVLTGVMSPATLVHGADLLEEFVRILKPSGVLFLVEPVSTGGENFAPGDPFLRRKIFKSRNLKL